MEGLLPELRWSDKERIRRHLRECRNAALRTRYLIIVNLLHGRSVPETMLALQVGRSTVYKVAKRFRDYGETGLVDRREDNGRRKLD
jgi:transposase